MKVKADGFLAVLVGIGVMLGGTVEHVNRVWFPEQSILRGAIVLPPPPPPADSLAIPGVYGYGADPFNTCLSPTDTVIVETVTSLSGDSSVVNTMLDILENHQHGDTITIVVWDLGGWSAPYHSVGGYDGKLHCTYLAMHTAPGGGVGYHRYRMLNINTDSRGFVVRGGTWAGDPRDPGQPVALIGIQDAQDFIFMENTILWPGKKHMIFSPTDATDTIRNVTLYRNLLGQSQNEPTSVQYSMGDNGGSSSRLTWARNLGHSNSYRNINIGGGQNVSLDASERIARFLGNVLYNTAQLANLQVRAWMVDVIDYYCKSGPMTNDGTPSGNDYSWCVVIPLQGSGNNADTMVELYVERLIGVHNRDTATTGDSLWAAGNFQEVACYYRDCNDPAGGGDILNDLTPALPAAAKRDTALTPATFEFARINPFTLAIEIFGTGPGADEGQVGAHQHLQCDGTLTFRADSMLKALLVEARDSTGVSNASQIDSTFVAARAEYTKAAGSACSDSDSDGMPNAFEVRIQGGTDSTGAVINADPDGDGFPNMMEYVNGTDPVVFTFSDGSEPTQIAPTYSAGGFRVWVRRLLASLQPIFFGAGVGDSAALPTYPESVPATASGHWLEDTGSPPTRVVHFTCDSVIDGGTVMDSAEFRDTLVAMGLDPDSIMAITPVGCD